MLEQRQRQQNTAADIGAFRAGQNAAALAANKESVGEYRQARDSSQGAKNAADQRLAATQLGIDPQASPADIAAAASGATTFDTNGMPTGAGTKQASVAPTTAAITNAARQTQAGVSGNQDASAATAYAGAVTAAGGSTDAFSGGIAPRLSTPGLRPAVAPTPSTGPLDAPVKAPAKPLPGTVGPPSPFLKKPRVKSLMSPVLASTP